MTDVAPTSVRPFVLDDLDGVMALIATCYGCQAADRERWVHSHLGHPGGRHGIMVAGGAGAVVGVQPMEIHDFRLAGKQIAGAVLTGVMVHPEWRRQGLFTRLLEACEQRAWELGAAFVTTMPNDRSRPGFIKRGYIEPGERVLMAMPLPARRGLAAQSKADWWARKLVGGAGWLLDPRRRWARWPGGREVGDLGAEVGVMARRVAESWPGVVLMRSSEWLAWRYPSGRPGSYRRWVVENSEGQCSGMAVTARERRRGLEVGYLVDLAAVDDDSAARVSSAACRGLWEDGAELAMTVVSCSTLVRAFRLVGFREAPRWISPKRFFTVYRPAPGREPELEALRDLGRWYQTLGDWDTV